MVMPSAARFMVAILVLAAFPAAGARSAEAEVPAVAKALLEGKQAPPLPKPEGDVVRVKDAAGLERAIAELKSNQTVVLAPGTYQPGRDLVVGADRAGPLRNVAIRGETGRRQDVIIRGAGQENRQGSPRTGFQFHNVDGALLADLSIGDYFWHPIMLQGGSGCRGVRMRNLRLFDAGEQFVKGTPGGPGRTGAKDCIVEYCLIEYTDVGPVANDGYTQGVDIHRGDRCIIRDCLFRNQHVRPGLKNQYGPAILMWNDSRDTLVERNVFLDCDRGVAFGLNDKPKDGPGTDHSGGMIRNNFFYTSKRITNADAPILAWNSPGTRILHNTVLTNGTYANAIECRFANAKGLVIANNLTDARIAARDGAQAEVYGNFAKAAPEMFADPAGGDLHLKAPPPEIAKRAEPLRAPLAAADCADDFDGQARRTDAPGDIGADQLGAPPAAPKAPDGAAAPGK